MSKLTMCWRIIKYVSHLFYCRHWKGHGIHSPYLFEFLHDVVYNEAGTEVPAGVLKLHRELRGDRTLIPEDAEAGAGSMVDRSPERTVRSFVRGSSVSMKYGALLYRITRWFKPEAIMELGTGVGLSAIYLSSGSPRTPVVTIEGNPIRADFSRKVIKRCGLDVVKVHRGDFDEALNSFIPDLKGKWVVFVDGNHRREPVLRYVRSLLEKAGEEAVIILDDIYWSREMHRAWKEVISWPEVRVGIDLFHMGILLLRRDLHRGVVKVKF